MENSWYALAAQDAFHVTIAGCGIGIFLATLWLPPTVSWTLIAVIGIAALAFGISYLIRKHR